MSEPLVTIAMPVRDCGSTVDAAVRSILNQTLDRWSLVLIDDGSTDSTLERIRAFSDERIRVYSDGRSLGLAARLNQAIELADGEYFARMDGDDIAYPERLERQVSVLDASPEIDLVGAPLLVFGVAGQPLGYRPCPQIHEEICANPRSGIALAHPTWCGRRGWFERHRYDEAAVRCEDQDLLLRSWKVSRFANVPSILLGYREERVDLRKTLLSRYKFVGSVVRDAGGMARLDPALAAIEQAAKGVADTLAVALGAESVLLKHRRRPLAAAEFPRWRKVWTGSGGV